MKRPLFFIALNLSFGIAAAYMADIPFFYLFSAGIASAALAIVFRRRGSLSQAFLLLAILLAGMLLYKNSSLISRDHISNIIKDRSTRVCLRGVIMDDPILSETRFGQKRHRFLVKTTLLERSGSWERASGLIMVDLFGTREGMDYGDEVVFEGELSDIPTLRNPYTFDYARYMRMKNIYGLIRVGEEDPIYLAARRPGTLRSFAYSIRHRIRGSIRRYFDPEDAGLLEAIIIGDRTGLKASQKDGFVKTGTVHILAISGLHVGLVAVIFLAIFRLFAIPRKIRYMLTIPVLLVYALISGSNPPVIRATIVFSILALGLALEREAEPLNSLGAAALF